MIDTADVLKFDGISHFKGEISYCMKTLLLYPVRQDGFYYPQLGLAYIAGYCRDKGHNICLLDCAKKKWNFTEFQSYLQLNIFDVIGITVFTFTATEVVKTIDIIKQVAPATIVVVGGHLISAVPDKTFTFFPKADFGLAGEGELSFNLLLKALENDGVYQTIPGLIFREKEQIKKNSPEMEPKLDLLGQPAWDLIDPPQYFEVFSGYKKTVPMVFSRGCPYKCTFCTASMVGGDKFRVRSVAHIIDEIIFLQKEFSVDTIAIQTEGIGSSGNFMQEFCKEIIDRKVQIEFTIPPGIRLSMVNEELLQLMHRAGFSEMITVGIESGCDRILKLMRKGITTEKIKEKIELLNHCGFKPTGNFIIGFPTETEAEIMQTIRFSRKLNIYQAAYHPFIPIPGAAATQMIIDNGELPENYNVMDLTTVDKASYAPPGLTVERLKEIQNEAILKFFLRPRIIWFLLLERDRFIFAVKKFKELLCKIVIRSNKNEFLFDTQETISNPE